MLNYPGSFLKCVDPFLSIDNDHFQCMSNETEENFRHNISICKNSDKIEFMKMSSVDFFKQIQKHLILFMLMGATTPT